MLDRKGIFLVPRHHFHCHVSDRRRIDPVRSAHARRAADLRATRHRRGDVGSGAGDLPDDQVRDARRLRHYQPALWLVAALCGGGAAHARRLRRHLRADLAARPGRAGLAVSPVSPDDGRGRSGYERGNGLQQRPSIGRGVSLLHHRRPDNQRYFWLRRGVRLARLSAAQAHAAGQGAGLHFVGRHLGAMARAADPGRLQLPRLPRAGYYCHDGLHDRGRHLPQRNDVAPPQFHPRRLDPRRAQRAGLRHLGHPLPQRQPAARRRHRPGRHGRVAGDRPVADGGTILRPAR